MSRAKDKLKKDGKRPVEPSPIPDAEVLVDVLGLIDETIPLEIVASWSESERDEVFKWASAIYLRASDNHVRIPKTPSVIDAHRRGKRPHLQLIKPVIVGKLR